MFYEAEILLTIMKRLWHTVYFYLKVCHLSYFDLNRYVHTWWTLDKWKVYHLTNEFFTKYIGFCIVYIVSPENALIFWNS